MKRFLLYITALLFSCGNIVADIQISVPKKWKNKTIYVWQTDINQVFNRTEGEPINQLKDTIKIKELTFSIPVKLDCPAKISILSPKKDETDYDHTLAEACVIPGEDLHLFFNENSVRAEGSPLNQQIAEIYTYNQNILNLFRKAYSRQDNDEATRLAKEQQQWCVDWIKTNPSAPGAGYALYQITNPKLIVEYADSLHGEALTSLFYPYTESWISRAKQILQRKASQESMSKGNIIAPNFSLIDLNGSTVSLTDFIGKWVIIDFWGSWCSPCLKGMPELMDIYRQYNGKLEILGIDCNDSEEAWRNTVARLELPWISLYQPEEVSVTKDYGVSAFPTKVVVNPEGKIQKIYSGASPSFKEDIDNWLNPATE